MRRVTTLLLLALVQSTAVLGAAGCDEPDSGLRKCDGGLCIEVFRGTYSTEPCAGAPTQSCTYVDVFFVLSQDGSSVRDLDASKVRMSINEHEVGVEGAASLTQQNGLLVTLLLDRSYSIEEAGATANVRLAAHGFLDALPDEAVVAVAGFASEPYVPVPFATDGTEKGSLTYFPLDGVGRLALDTIIDNAYQPYQAPESAAFTKLYDAVGNLADLRPVDGDHAAMQAVNIVLSDGADTASTSYRSASQAMAHVGMVASDLKIYAVGLGDAIDQHALDEISEGRSYLAADASALDGAFASVANDLGAIYRYRILVAEAEYDARATLSVSHGGHGLKTSFDLASIGGDGSGDGGLDRGDVGETGEPPIDPSSTCTLPCTDSTSCGPSEACLNTTEGYQCMPAQCAPCFALGLTCSYFVESCGFGECK